jgi:chemotaxis response regulator CheB
MKVVIAESSKGEGMRLASVVWAMGDGTVIAVARGGSDAIRTVLDEEPDVLILGARFDPAQGLGLLHAVRPLLPELRVIVIGDRPSDQFRRAFLLGDIDLLVGGPERMDVMSDMLRQWRHEERRKGWTPFFGAPRKSSHTAQPGGSTGEDEGESVDSRRPGSNADWYGEAAALTHPVQDPQREE